MTAIDDGAPAAPRRILVTNDDGIDSVGIGVLARAMRRFGEVTVICPDTEYSGAGASIGALHIAEPEIAEAEIDGIDTAWTVSGPPALCVFYARLGAFGFMPDLIVSGINPGANVGRAVYHSGTIGAALTGRNGDIPGIAVSQAFADPLEDTDEARRDYDERVGRQLWDSAAEVAAEVVDGMLATDFPDCAVVNLNVPNRPVAELSGWRWAEVGRRPPWAVETAELVPIEDRPGRYRVAETWGPAGEQPAETDGALVTSGQVAISLLSRIEALSPVAPEIDKRLDAIVSGG
ncbi:MAG: 5'/3'-nucleotidase SurE [Actinomycetota bacterium]